MSGEFKAKILAFACNWCAYSAADLAGVSRFQYPANMRIIRIMCSGRLNPNFILEGFANGADGVLVAGWHIGDCHYLEGNKKAQGVFNTAAELVQTLGIEPERIRLEWISSAEGTRFAEVASEFTRTIEELGPLRLTEPAWAADNAASQEVDRE